MDASYNRLKTPVRLKDPEVRLSPEYSTFQSRKELRSVKPFELYSFYLFPKNIFDGTRLSTIERKVVSNHLSKVKLVIQCLHERYQLLFFKC